MLRMWVWSDASNQMRGIPLFICSTLFYPVNLIGVKCLYINICSAILNKGADTSSETSSRDGGRSQYRIPGVYPSFFIISINWLDKMEMLLVSSAVMLLPSDTYRQNVINEQHSKHQWRFYCLTASWCCFNSWKSPEAIWVRPSEHLMMRPIRLLVPRR